MAKGGAMKYAALHGYTYTPYSYVEYLVYASLLLKVSNLVDGEIILLKID